MVSHESLKDSATMSSGSRGLRGVRGLVLLSDVTVVRSRVTMIDSVMGAGPVGFELGLGHMVQGSVD